LVHATKLKDCSLHAAFFLVYVYTIAISTRDFVLMGQLWDVDEWAKKLEESVREGFPAPQKIRRRHFGIISSSTTTQ
jgi:hypothetical protein